MGAPPTQTSEQATLEEEKQQYKPRTTRIVCRCCLSEEDEMTDYLSLDAIAAIDFRDICYGDDDDDDDVGDGNGNDDGGSQRDDAAVSESSSATATTLLDCLNGCARIGATLEDATLPLHICLDCSQALEACCEFIRCVRNADKILRRKQRKQRMAMIPKEAKSQTSCATAQKVVDLKCTLGEMTVTQTQTVRCFGEQQEQLTIGSLSLQDLIEDTDIQDLDLEKGAKTDCQSGIVKSSQANILNFNAQPSADTVLNGISSYINFDFTQDNRLLEATLKNSNSETENLSERDKNDICEFYNTNTKTTSITTNSKDCNKAFANAETNSNPSAKAIPEQHKFIPPLVRDTTHCEIMNERILTEDVTLHSIATVANLKDCAPSSHNESILQPENVPFKNYKTTQFATLNLDGRKYIVNAAIANDLKKFHKDNEYNFSYLCKFCIFMCVSQKALDHHLIKHLGPPCYSCSECNFRCRFKYYLKKHMRSAHSAVRENLDVVADIREHALSQQQGATKFYCSLCRCYFSSFIALQQHHHNDEEPWFRCSHCGQEESEREQLMEHMAAEHKVFIDAHLIASYIPNATKTAQSLQSPTTFSSSSATSDVDKTFLSQFIKLQSKEPKVFTAHICKFCGRNFKRHFHLLRHEHLSHQKDNKKEKETFLKRHSSKFVRKQYARQLLRATQAEHQFKCEPCRHVFKTHVDLVAHMQTHGNAKYECDTCHAVFTFEFELKYHLRTHSSPSSSTSPRSEYFAPDSNLGLNKALQSRLLQLKQQKKISPHKRLALDSGGINRRTISKRRLSLASVSTAKSSEEGSLNSPSNANSDEEMPPASSLESSSSIDYEYKEDDLDTAPISAADVMLPQTFQRSVMQRLSSISSTNTVTSKFRSSSPIVGSGGTAQVQNSSTNTANDKQLNTGETNDQNYLNDFDLNLLDYSDDFWLQLSSF